VFFWLLEWETDSNGLCFSSVGLQGLFIAAYCLGRQSHRPESGADPVGSPEPPGVVAGRGDAPNTQKDDG
jgi:hypothetical protein